MTLMLVASEIEESFAFTTIRARVKGCVNGETAYLSMG